MFRQLPLLVAGALLTIASAFITEPLAEERLEDAAIRMQARVALAQGALQAKVDAILPEMAAVPSDSLWQAPLTNDDEVGIRIFRNGELQRWNDHAPVTDAALDSASDDHLLLADGVYLHARAHGGAWSVQGLQRIWQEPPFENRYLRKQFGDGFAPADGIIAQTGPGLGPVVRDVNGHVFFRLQWLEETALPGGRSLIAVLAALAAACCFIVALWQLARSIARAAVAVALFVSVIIMVRLLSLLHGPFPLLSGYPLFDPSLFAASWLMPSLGDLLINAALLVIMAAFIHVALGSATKHRSFSLATTALLLLFGSAMWINSVIVALVRDSSVSLDLFHVQSFDVHSWLALLGIAALFAAWLLAANAPVRCTDLPSGKSLLLVLTGAAVVLGVYHLLGNYDAMLGLWPAPLLILLFAMQRARTRTTAVLLVLATLALFTAHILNRQTLKRAERDREALAENASTREDPVIELLFREAAQDIRADATVRALVSGPVPCTPTDLDRAVRQGFFNGYWERYDVRLHLFGADGKLLCSTSPDAPPTAEQMHDRIEQGVPTAGDQRLRSVHRPGEEALYLGVVSLADTGTAHSLYVELRPRLITEGLGFPELLLAGDPAQQRTDRFTRARYERGALTESTGAYTYPITWHAPIPGDGLHYIDHGYDLLAQGDPRATVLVLGMRIPLWLDHVTTFSYLFLFYCTLAALIALVRMLVLGHRMPSLGVSGKLRLGVMLFAVMSLALFAIGTQHLLDSRSAQRSGRTLTERTLGALTELRQTLHAEPQLTTGMSAYLDHLLSKLSNVFFTDLTLYAPDGSLLATSREQVFNAGLLGRRMDADAYFQLAKQGDESFLHEESIGTARFRASYMPLRNDRGEVLAYLALPYFARQGEMDQEKVASYVAMVNLFTLLFLLSAGAAAMITSWTTRPLLLLKRGLERIGLGAHNEPIPYRGDDELGELVRVYNRKVEELRVSAEKLARSERESAWREMAKQVAHEIKNPLTPMKLNIQQFQRAWTPDAPDARERLDRFSKGLVEQIDALSRIAGEFGHFAQMPPAHAVDLDLREVAESAVALFGSSPEATITLKAEEALVVHADREHLLRILNNLIKNALQSVPEERRAMVNVFLRKEESDAVIEVRDNGSGIPLNVQERLFTPSFTTKTSGMGLGLAMVRRMVEEAGGSVRFITAEGVGTSFLVSLPLRK